jgi:hypothetical protein
MKPPKRVLLPLEIVVAWTSKEVGSVATTSAKQVLTCEVRVEPVVHMRTYPATVAMWVAPETKLHSKIPAPVGVESVRTPWSARVLATSVARKPAKRELEMEAALVAVANHATQAGAQVVFVRFHTLESRVKSCSMRGFEHRPPL